MKTNRTGITRLTTGQCRGIVGGDPGMSLACGTGVFGGAACAAMGYGVAGGPMVSVEIGLPMPTSLGDFDKVLIGAVGGSAAGFTTALGGWALGSAAVLLAPAVAVGVTAIVVGGAAGYGAMRLIQYANDDMAYAGRVRRAIP